MKIGITADMHIKQNGLNPERFNALKNILDQLLEEKVYTLFVAGDLFDSDSNIYTAFDSLCKKYDKINIHLIPGNHDPMLNQKLFTANNIYIYSEPTIITIDDNPRSFFFIPYKPNKSMGAIIAEHSNKLTNHWILISHGDYITGTQTPNPYEPGIYMPLTRNDIENHNPALVILGHIHKRETHGIVQYPGSPCGMDINETGKRKFLLLDTNTLIIEEKVINNVQLFFNETFIVLPVNDEFNNIKTQLEKRIAGWGLSNEEIPKARIRLKFRGFTSDKSRLMETIKKTVKNYKLYKDEDPDLSGVSVLVDQERIEIIEKARETIDNMEWNDTLTNKDDLLEQALNIILND